MDEPQERQDEKHSELRRHYRESALQLSSECDASIGWGIAQWMLDQIWDDHSVEPRQPIVYGCKTCGFIIHPGYMGTTIRLASGKKSEKNRTRRRREQRVKRKVAISKQKQKKGLNALKNVDSLPKTGTKVVIFKDDASVVFDRHHLVITCGRCRSSVRCKGLKRDLPSSKSLSAIATSRNAVQTEEVTPITTPTSDFVALPPDASKPTNRLIHIERQKKKKKAPPKSNLMKFLNSLND